jgi:putative SbcD/Mre11-related phosphoesterase
LGPTILNLGAPIPEAGEKGNRMGRSKAIPLFPHPALLLEKGGERALVIADLHIGWEMALSEQGIHIPSQTRRFLERILGLIRDHEPSLLILLGDVKHTIAKADMAEWRDVPEFLDALRRSVREVVLVPGNHDGGIDPLLPSGIKMLGASGMRLWDRYGLLHGHAWPGPELLECDLLIMAHMHPTVTLSDPLGFRIIQQVWIRGRCDRGGLRERVGRRKAGVGKRGDLDCLIMPSFNDFLGGQSINRGDFGEVEYIGPILRSGLMELGESDVYMLDGTYLGKAKGLIRGD